MAHPFNRNEIESATLGVLTRLALWFDLENRGTVFTGHDVSGILIGAWHSYESSKGDTAEIASQPLDLAHEKSRTVREGINDGQGARSRDAVQRNDGGLQTPKVDAG